MRGTASLSRSMRLAALTLSTTVLLPLTAAPRRSLPAQSVALPSSIKSVPQHTASAGPVLTNQANQQTTLASYGKLPLRFEENVGQTDSQVRYISRGSGYTLFLTSGEAVF